MLLTINSKFIIHSGYWYIIIRRSSLSTPPQPPSKKKKKKEFLNPPLKTNKDVKTFRTKCWFSLCVKLLYVMAEGFLNTVVCPCLLYCRNIHVILFIFHMVTIIAFFIWFPLINWDLLIVFYAVPFYSVLSFVIFFNFAHNSWFLNFQFVCVCLFVYLRSV